MVNISSYLPYFHINESREPRRAEQFVKEVKRAAKPSQHHNIDVLVESLREAAMHKAGNDEQWLVQMVRESTDLWAAEHKVRGPKARATTV